MMSPLLSIVSERSSNVNLGNSLPSLSNETKETLRKVGKVALAAITVTAGAAAVVGVGIATSGLGFAAAAMYTMGAYTAIIPVVDKVISLFSKVIARKVKLAALVVWVMGSFIAFTGLQLAVGAKYGLPKLLSIFLGSMVGSTSALIMVKDEIAELVQN